MAEINADPNNVRRLLNPLQISAQGMRAQRARMEVMATNIAMSGVFGINDDSNAVPAVRAAIGRRWPSARSTNPPKVPVAVAAPAST